jgi:hypothetical protein
MLRLLDTVDRAIRSACDEAVPSYHALVAIALLSIAARPYHDTKDRFSLELAPGWELTPQFGDTLGMVFKKMVGKRRPTMALFMVRVAPPGTGGSRTFADATEEVFAAQPAFKKLGESKLSVGGRPGFVRKYEAEVEKGSGITKRIDAHYLEASGNVYLIHVETTAAEFPKIEPDVRAMLASFEPGRSTAVEAPPPPPASGIAIIGRWINDDGLILLLDPDGTFALADVSGRYETTTDSLTLIIPKQGRESFSFTVAEKTLTLRSPNLPAPMTYRRVQEKTAHHTSADIAGAWETVGTKQPVSLDLRRNGDFTMGEFQGRWTYEKGQLRLERTSSEVVTYDAKLEGDRLILAGADLDRPIALRRK